MKFLHLILISISSLMMNVNTQIDKEQIKSETLQWQAEQNEYFKDPKTSPLTKKDLSTFKKLDFYNYEDKYVVKAKLTYTPFAPVFRMKTTTSRLPEYKKFAIATFVIDGKEYELSIYQNQELIHKKGYEDYLFIPYNDLTNGSETYGGGRYIDLKQSGSDEIIINFNKSYNPYCAYNPKYSCPIPPNENNLNLRIEAGVKSYKKQK